MSVINSTAMEPESARGTFLSTDGLAQATQGTWLSRPAQSWLAGVSTDSRGDIADRAFFALRGPRFDGHDHVAAACAAGAAVVVVARPCAVPTGAGVLLVENPQRALVDTARVWRERLLAHVTAITGSAGKTTTRQLIAAALATQRRVHASPKSFNNEIGLALTILSCPREAEELVLELGTNHHGEIAMLAQLARPHTAVVTNIGRVHLSGLGSLAGVAQEKAALLAALNREAHGFADGQSPELAAAVATGGVRARIHWLRSDRISNRCPDATGQTFEAAIDGLAVTVRTRLHGEHNARNALTALRVALHRGIGRNDALRGIAAVEAVEGRLAPQMAGSILVVNDSYNANPESVLAAIAALGEIAPSARRRVVCLGDMLELGDQGPQLHAAVGRRVAAARRDGELSAAHFIGELSAHGAQECVQAGLATRVTHSVQLESECLTALEAALLPGDAVLIKASRGSALERLIPAIERAGSAAAA